MDITVLLFAGVAEKAGVRHISLERREGDTVASVRDRVVARFPQVAPLVATLVYALDEEYVKDWEPVGDRTTLALIPPVSGG